MMATLPAHPNLTHLKHEAKQLLRAQRKGQSGACSILSKLRRFEHSTPDKILNASVALHETQYALALHYGFNSWQQLLKHVRTIRQSDTPNEPSLVNRHSLAATIDSTNEVMFLGKQLSASQKRQVAEFVVSHFGLNGAFEGFTPTDSDKTTGYRLFTGERMTPGPGANHILSEEACRILLLLDVKTVAVTQAMASARKIVDQWMDKSLTLPVRSAGSLQPGMFCCMKCSCALWRHIAARKEHRNDAFLAAGVKALRVSRDNEGDWRLWPWHYTLLTLQEIGTPEAKKEIRYSAQACERELTKRISKTNIYSQRRRAVVEKAMASI